MDHINNIAVLFGKNFIESPLIESYEAGSLTLATGKLVACDPLITKDMPAFAQRFPTGSFPIVVHKERETDCIAYVEVQFSANPPTEWHLATIAGQDVSRLAAGEIFGFPVESGMGCLMDAQAQHSLNQLESLLFERKGSDFMGIYEEFFHPHFFDENGATDQYASLMPDPGTPANIFAFETGYGEGFYASYIGLDAAGAPTKFVTEFIEIQGN